MDNKVTRERLNNHLEYDWFKYLLLLAVMIAVVIFAFNIINDDRENETLQVFATCYEYRDSTFGESARSLINRDMDNEGDKGARLRSVAVESQRPDTSEYVTLLQTHGDVTSDLLILGKTYLDSSYKYSMLTWDEYVIERAIPETLRTGENPVITDDDFYWYEASDGQRYRKGLRIDNLQNVSVLFDFTPPEIPEDSILHEDLDSLSDADKDKYLSEKSKFESEFYLVINPTLVNIGEKGGKKSDPADAQTFRLISKLLWRMETGILG